MLLCACARNGAFPGPRDRGLGTRSWSTAIPAFDQAFERCRERPPLLSSSASKVFFQCFRPSPLAGASVVVQPRLDDVGVDNAFHGLSNCIYCLCHVCCEHVSDGCGVIGCGFEFIRTLSRSPRRRISLIQAFSPSRTSRLLSLSSLFYFLIGMTLFWRHRYNPQQTTVTSHRPRNWGWCIVGYTHDIVIC